LERGVPLGEGRNIYDRSPIQPGRDTFDEGQTSIGEDTEMEPPDVVVADYIQNTFGVTPQPLHPDTVAKDHEGITNL
jgi:hypothetical protein